MKKEPTTLRGLRRELTQSVFEDLGSLQCTVGEILGYIGTTEKKLEQWCRRNYGCCLEQMLDMVRQDGLIAIRRASFEQLKKSATIVAQQYNRYLPGAGAEPGKEAEAAIRAFAAAASPSDEDLRLLFPGPDGE